MLGERKGSGAATREEAERIGIAALGFLAGDEALMGRFLALSGIEPMAIRAHVGDPAFFAGLLDFVLADERTLSAFCESSGTPAQNVEAAREALGASFAARPR